MAIKNSWRAASRLACAVMMLMISLEPAWAQASKSESSQSSWGSRIHVDRAGRSALAIRFPQGRAVSAAAFVQDRQALGLSAHDALKPFRVFTDQFGQTHYRFRQYHKGVELAEIELLLHEKNGALFYAHGELVPGLDAEVRPALAEQAALQAALARIGAQKYMWQLQGNEAFSQKQHNDRRAAFYPRGELQLSAGMQPRRPENFKLVYRFDIHAAKPYGRYQVDVDAHTGAVASVVSLLRDVDVPGRGLSVYNGSVPITVDEFGANLFRLRQSGRGGGIETFDLKNQDDLDLAEDFVDSDTNFTAAHARAGVSAHWALEATYDYFLTAHNRNSFDNAGGKIVCYVHLSNNLVNAFWNGSHILVGDGANNNAPLTTLDVLGHELTHGVTQYAANLIYANEPGALNESFSDIFGELVENFALGDNDWLIGREFGAFRSMQEPNDFGNPNTYLGRFWVPTTTTPGPGNDNGGVHTNSGVQNHWFYLLSEGGSGVNDLNEAYAVTGIGLEQAAQIAYRNLTVYLGRSSGYREARFASMFSAIDLFGFESPQYQAALAAWSAVGVLYPTIEPAVVTSTDTASFLAEAGVASDTAEITITNFGLDDLNITSLSVSGAPFQIISPPSLPHTLNYDFSLTVKIAFQPTAPDVIWGALNIASNDPAHPLRAVALRGKSFAIRPPQPGVIYAVAGRAADGVLLTIDPNSGDGQPIGPSGFDELTGISIRPSNGEIYGTIANSANTALVRVDAQTGEAFARTVVPVPNLRAIAFDVNDDLYGAQFTGGQLFRIDPATGNATLIGATGLNLLSGLAINPVDGSLWGAPVGRNVYKINKATAAATLAGNSGFSRLAEIEFDAEGKLFGLSGFGQTTVSDFLQLDPTTAQGTLIGSTGVPAVFSLVMSGAVPSAVAARASAGVPREHALHQNHPNPFNPSTRIAYDLPKPANVSLKIFDLAGQEIRTLVHGKQSAGAQSIYWDGRNEAGSLVSTGVYVYQLRTDDFVRSRKMLFLR